LSPIKKISNYYYNGAQKLAIRDDGRRRMSKTALITGASSGIGAAYAKSLASQGYDLILTGRRQEKIQKVAKDLSEQSNVKAEVIIAEFTNDTDIQKVVDAIKSHENLEMLVNNAGYFDVRLNFNEKDLVLQETMMKVLMTAPVRLTHAALPDMIKNGRGIIINVSSGAAFYPFPGQAIYASCKAFLRTFSERLQLEMKDKGIIVQAVCPGLIDTDFYRFLPEAKNMIMMAANFPIMSAESVVECSLKELGNNRVVCIPGAFYKAAAQKLTAAFVQELTQN
jgi:short-subunit dehydrogenase